MVSEGRIYKIVPRKGTKTGILSSFKASFKFIKLFPVRGRKLLALAAFLAVSINL